jgi:hypothetical protein
MVVGLGQHIAFMHCLLLHASDELGLEVQLASFTVAGKHGHCD